MNNHRLKKAARNWWDSLERQRWERGTIGRLNADGTYTVRDETRVGFVHVRMDSGSMTIARDAGKVPLRATLPVRMRREAGVLVLESEDTSGLLEGDTGEPSNDYGVPAHPIGIHTDVTMTSEAAGNVLKYDGTDWINSSSIPEAVAATIDGATEQTVMEAANRIPLTDTGVVKWISWTNFLASTKTYFDTLYDAIGSAATVAAALVTHAALTATHGVVGAIVGTTDTQTLTNKTLTTPTIADFTNAAHDHGDADDGGALTGYMDLTTAQTVATGIKTFTPGIVTPTIDGSIAANGDITIQGTTNATRTSSYVLLQPNGGDVGIGVTPGAKLDLGGAFRALGTGTTPSANGAGQAIELWYWTGAGGPYGLLLAFDRDAGTYKPVRIAGDSIGFEEGASRIMTIDGGFVGILVSVPLTPLQVHVGTNQNLGVASVSGETTITAYNDTGAANVPLRIASDGALFVQPTIGNAVQSLQSTSTGDDPIEVVVQARVATTNATVTTLWSTTLAASTTYTITATLVARRTGGAAGAADDSFGQIMTGVFRLTGGVAVLVGWNQYAQHRDQIWTAVFDVTGATVRIRVTGAASNNITWHATIRLYPVSS